MSSVNDVLIALLPERGATEVPSCTAGVAEAHLCTVLDLHLALQGLSSSALQEYVDRLDARKAQVCAMLAAYDSESFLYN